MIVIILDTLDKNFIGTIAETDLFSLSFLNGEKFNITGRLHYGK